MSLIFEEDNLQKIKSFVIFDLNYFIAIKDEKLQIYTTKNLALVQEISGIKEKMINFYFLKKKNTLLLLCEKRMYFFNCVFTQLGTINWILDYKSEYLKNDFNKICLTSNCEKIIGYNNENIFIYFICFLSQGKLYNKVKKVFYKKKISYVNNNIEKIDIDTEERFLVLLEKNKSKSLKFFKMEDIYKQNEEDENKFILKDPFFSLNFQHRVREFSFCKNLILEDFHYKNFLIIQTKKSFLIYRKSKRKIFKKIIALLIDGSYGEKTLKFDFIFENDCISDKSADNLKGALYFLKGTTLKVYYIRNLFKKKQALIEDKYEVLLNDFKHDEILSIINYNSKKIKVITYSNNFIFVKYRLDVLKNRIQCSVEFFKLLKKSVETKKIIYNERSKFIYGKLKKENEIFLKLKNYYEKQFFFEIINDCKHTILEGFWTLLGVDLLVNICLNENMMEFYQILSDRENISLKEKIKLEVLEGLKIEMIKFVIRSNQKFYGIFKTAEKIIIEEYELENHNFKNKKRLTEINTKEISDYKIEYIEMILQFHKKVHYRIILSTSNKEIITFNLETEKNKKIQKKKIIFEKNILEIYKNKKHPYNYIILTSDNYLHFYSNELKLQSKYDLSIMKIDLKNNANNFNLKNLYDNFYILYFFKEIKVGCLEFFDEENKFKFFIIEHENFFLKELNYYINLNSNHRDKIVFFNHKNVCIRNDDKLVYGSLVLNNSNLESVSKKSFEMNLHKYILLEYYNFSYFKMKFVFECLKKGREFFLYQFLIVSLKHENKPRFNFDPDFIFKNLYLTKEEFLEKNNFMSINEFFYFIDEWKNKINQFSEEKRSVFLKTVEILELLKSNSQSLDVPSKIFFVESLKNKINLEKKIETENDIITKNNEIIISSEMIILAICSDQKDFLLNYFLPSNFQNPPNWEDMKKNCVIYWYNNIQKIKQFLDRSTMKKYKKEKNVFDILFWFVLFGKTRLLVPLFKLEAGQEKFVKFFSLNFNDEKVIKRTIDNAFVLKSKKKFELCVAFFLLVKFYSEAINIILMYMNDPQLALLVYKINENKIKADEKQNKEIRDLFKNFFIDKAEECGDYFLMAIGYNILEDYENMFESLFKVNTSTKIVFLDEDSEKEKFFGFKFCNFSIVKQELFNFIKKTASLKRFFISVEKKKSEKDLEKIYWDNFIRYYTNNDIYMALTSVIEIKINNIELYEKLVKENVKIFQGILKKIGLKKLKNLIKKNYYWRINDKFEKLHSWSKFFYIEPEKIIKKINKRIYLVHDFELNIFNKLNTKNYIEANEYFKDLLDKLILKTKKLLELDIFKYKSSHKWIIKINLVEKFIDMLNNLFIKPDPCFLEFYSKYKFDFDNIIIFWLFLISLHTNSWEECIVILENYHSFDILSTDFLDLLNTLKTKIKNKYLFFGNGPIKDTNDVKFYYSNLNILIFLFTKNLYFSTFLKNRVQLNNKYFSNIIDMKLSEYIDVFKNSLKKNFFKILNSFPYEEKTQIKNEIIDLFNSNTTNLKRMNFYILTPKEALELEINKRVTSKILNTPEWYEILNEYIIYSLLEDDYKNLSHDKFEERKKFFGKGIEIFKIKQEQNPINFFSTGIITKTIISRNELAPDIYILINKKIRKVYLFNSLFKKMRNNNGYNLYRYDDVNSISVVNEMPSILSEGFLSEKPIVLRILFNFLFKGPPSQKNKHSSKVFERIIDQKIQKSDDFSNITYIENHKELPILFLSQNNQFFVISKKTLATLCSFTDKSLKKIKCIIPDCLGYKILLIDNQKNAFVLKYDLTFSNVELIFSIEGKSIYSGDWIENSTKIFFTTYSSKIIIFDFIEMKIEELELPDPYLVKNLIITSKSNNKIILINKSRAEITTLNGTTFDILDIYKPKTESITSYLLDDDKNILITGHSNGEVRFLDLKFLDEIDVQQFEDEDRKKHKIENLVFLGDFIVASFSNGLLSIIGKI